MDNQQRIALVRIGTPFPDDTTPAVKYQLSDHLGSSNVVIDDTGARINREEYTPYGETSFGSFARKRYRYTGKERDEESSLYYHGARYYAPWLARWVSCDPAGMVDGVGLYGYTRENPVRFTDPTGTQTLIEADVDFEPEEPDFEPEEPDFEPEEPETSSATSPGAPGSSSGTSPGAPGTSSSTLPPLPKLTIEERMQMESEWIRSQQEPGLWAMPGRSPGQPNGTAIAPPPSPEPPRVEPIVAVPIGDPNHGTPYRAPGDAAPVPKQDPSKGGNVPLEAGRPNAARSEEHRYWGYYWDPYTNDIKFANEVMAADHIYPDRLIRRLPGFDQLTSEQQDAVLNYEGNFQPLLGPLNSSKGSKTAAEWTSALGRAVHPGYISDMTKMEAKIKEELQQMIDGYLQACMVRR